MRLLPVRHDPGRRRAAEGQAEADRRRHRRGDDQYLPLRHLWAGARRDQYAPRRPRHERQAPSRRAVLIGGGGLGLLVGVGVWRADRQRPARRRNDGRDRRLPARLDSYRIAMGRSPFAPASPKWGRAPSPALQRWSPRNSAAGSTRSGSRPAPPPTPSRTSRSDAIFSSPIAASRRTRGRQASADRPSRFVAEAATQQITGGSSTIADRFIRAREAGAARARSLLIAAAARQWGVAATDCAAKDGAVVHAASKRSLGFGELAKAAASETPPASLALKPREQWTLIGGDSPAFRHPRQGRRQRAIWHRRAAAGHAVRGRRQLPGVRRRARRASTTQRPRRCRASSEVLRRSGRRRRRRRQHLARQARARRAENRLGRR